jgi:hypothetical protein
MSDSLHGMRSGDPSLTGIEGLGRRAVGPVRADVVVAVWRLVDVPALRRL